MMGIIWAQSQVGTIVGGAVTKVAEGIINVEKNIQQIQSRVQSQFESQYKVQPIPTPAIMPKINLSKIPTIDTAQIHLHRIILQKAEILRMQKMAFDEKYRLTFPMNTTIVGPIGQLNHSGLEVQRLFNRYQRNEISQTQQ